MIIEHPTPAELEVVADEYAREQSKKTTTHVQGCMRCLQDVDRHLNGERKTVAHMVAEFLLEGGLLFFIFGILDALIESHPVPEGWYFFVTIVSIVGVGGGMALERYR